MLNNLYNGKFFKFILEEAIFYNFQMQDQNTVCSTNNYVINLELNHSIMDA
jgi:hypothetical protein